MLVLHTTVVLFQVGCAEPSADLVSHTNSDWAVRNSTGNRYGRQLGGLPSVPSINTGSPYREQQVNPRRKRCRRAT